MRTFLTLLGLLVVLTACGLEDKVETVDQSVSLLQELDSAGLGIMVGDGVVDLASDSPGYHATLAWENGTGSVALEVRADAGGSVQFAEADGATYHYDTEQGYLYELDAGQFACVQDGAAYERYHTGLRSAFDAAEVFTTGARLMVVTEEDEDAGDLTHLERDVTRYTLVSRLEDAREILERVANDDLQARVSDATGDFELAGELLLDDETWALMVYIHRITIDDQVSEFSFTVTQWDDVDDLPTPTEATVSVPCAD